VTAIVAGVGIGVHIGWFYWHSDHAGANLLHKEEAAIAAARSASSVPPRVASHAAEFDEPALPRPHVRNAPLTPPTTSAASCQDPAPAAGQPEGIVEAKSIGLEAPVIEGTDEAQLAVAVGHVPGSVWPGGSTGTTVFSAHDVSWFSSIDQLAPGSKVSFVEPCKTFIYTVTSHAVVTAGSPVYNTAKPSLVLDTCYPLDALWITPQRFLVYADLTQVQSGGHTTQLPAATDGSVPTSLPSSLATQVAARVTTSGPLGPLTITGTPAAAWRESIEPINAAGTALTLYFGALELAGNGDTAGWAQAAPGLGTGPIGPLWDGEVTGNETSISPTLAVKGSKLTGATVTSTVDISGGNAPGTYQITMQSAVKHGILTITGWQMTPA
jgi:sortase A